MDGRTGAALHLLLAVALCLLCACSLMPATPQEPAGPSETAPPVPDGGTPDAVPAEPRRAAVIDQLYTLQPNPAFIEKVTGQLEDCGFAVDLYQGDEVTVDLYRRLSGLGYRLIIFRAHSGLLSGDGDVVRKTSLFTNEEYSERKHVAAQLADQLAKARIDQRFPYVFSIREEFVTEGMEGRFDGTVIVMMGCSCLRLEDLAGAFVFRGASSYLGWHATVELGYVDRATPYLLRQLCGEGATIKSAVADTMAAVGPDPTYGARLKYYPAESGGKTLQQLTG